VEQSLIGIDKKKGVYKMPDKTIKVADLKATMLDSLIETYLTVDDNEVMVELLLNQISNYIDLLSNKNLKEAGEGYGSEKDS